MTLNQARPPAGHEQDPLAFARVCSVPDGYTWVCWCDRTPIGGRSWSVWRAAAAALERHLQREHKVAAVSCGKKGLSAVEARAALDEATRCRVLLADTRRNEQSVYRCTVCLAGPWHLTSLDGLDPNRVRVIAERQDRQFADLVEARRAAAVTATVASAATAAADREKAEREAAVIAQRIAYLSVRAQETTPEGRRELNRQDATEAAARSRAAADRTRRSREARTGVTELACSRCGIPFGLNAKQRAAAVTGSAVHCSTVCRRLAEAGARAAAAALAAATGQDVVTVETPDGHTSAWWPDGSRACSCGTPGHTLGDPPGRIPPGPATIL